METSTKIILLITMYGLPLCLAIIYRLNENIKLKRKIANRRKLL
ncbi:hypothetical protein [Ferruginibacter sp.]